jgi:ketosteroid isomerase-like protein
MRTQLRCLIFIFALLNLFSAQAQTDEQQVQQTVIKAFDALSAKDAATLRSLCTADVRFNEYGEAWTLDTLITKAITRNTVADFKRTNRLDFISTTVKGDIAWTTYNLHSSVTANGKNVEVYWMETVIAIREEKKWKIKVLHSTRVDKK